MIYIGSGLIADLLAKSEFAENSHYDFLWGRRAKNIRFSNIKSIFRKNVIYLDTVDAWHNNATGKLWVWWFLSPYRIEKVLTNVMLRMLCKSVVRLHVPAIVDSAAWQKLIVDDDSRSLRVPGFTYHSLLEFVSYADSRHSSRRSYTSIEMFEFAKSEGMEIRVIRTNSNVNATKLLSGML